MCKDHTPSSCHCEQHAEAACCAAHESITVSTAHHEHHHHDHGHHCCCCCEEQEEGHSHEHHHHHGMELQQWVGIALSVVLLAIGIFANPLPETEWLIFLLAYIPVGYPIFKEAFGEISHGDVFNEFTLMIIATIGAFGIGEYPEAISVLLFYSLGEYFQGRAASRAREDIQSLISLRPDHATVINEKGEHIVKKPEEVCIGETLEVKAGERIPVDCKLTSDHADFDSAALTGESVPRALTKGDEVLAGMIAVGGPVTLTVIRPYGQSALQRILTLVQDAARHKSPAERFIRRFARIYTPAVTLLAALIALLPPLTGFGAWSTWFYRALVFLVISCPCALVVSIPLCYFRGIGIASRHGILFKGGNYLDAITRVRKVVFDKTGTLTSGEFGIVKTIAAPGFSEQQILQHTAALERFSTHPLAQAIVEGAHDDADHEIINVEEHSGHGLRGLVNGHETIIGHADFLHAHHISFNDCEEQNSPYTFVFCAIDGKYAGKIALCDQARSDAREAIARLHELGIHETYMLSGDRKAVVKSLAKELGIDRYHGELLPEDKARIFGEIKGNAKDELTAFVGDGINDAPVLALSDVGIAMGQGGSDAAVETADVVIHNSRPSCVADAVSIGRKTRQIVNQNLVLAIGLKVSVLILGALGLTGLWAAVLADTGVALLCVANTYRIKK